jgi:signal transduction histidine kinase
MALLSGFRQIGFTKTVKEIYGEQLMYVTLHIESHLPPSFEEWIIKHDVLHSPTEMQVMAINVELQPLIEEVSKAHPNLEMGIYSIELDSVLASAPNFEPSKLNSLSHTRPVFKVYETGQHFFAKTDSTVWGGDPMYTLAYPLVQEGRLIGHIATSIKYEDLSAFSRSRNYQLLFASLIIYIMILILARFSYNRLSIGLTNFTRAAIEGVDYTNTGFLPELEPLLIQLRKHQWNIKMETVSEFAASVVHEVRNPITSIRGFSQLLLNKETDQQKVEYLKTILEEMDTVSEIITSFLKFTKPSMAKVKSVPVLNLINDIENLTGVQCLDNRVTLTIEAAEDDIEILCDISQLKQVMLNLIQNAIHTMEGKKNKRLTIHIMRREEMVKIDVCDNGTGIIEENMGKLFEPFFSTKATGTGLGLSTCKQLLEQQAGFIEVRSELGKGSVFSIILPAADKTDIDNENGLPTD